MPCRRTRPRHARPAREWLPEPPDSLRKEAIGLLRDAREHAERDYRIALETMLVDGDPVDEILRVARTKGVDTIVIGSHSRIGMQRWFLGSVAEGVMRGSTVPVLVVHSVAPAAERQERGAL
jgi:nucleotide-binding universal stress UspA family protein